MLAKQMFINIKNKYEPKMFELQEKEQEIINLNIRLKAQEEAKENLQKEKEQILNEYKKEQEKISNRIYRKIRGIIKGKK